MSFAAIFSGYLDFSSLAGGSTLASSLERVFLGSDLDFFMLF
jgi:hypothetical protein